MEKVQKQKVFDNLFNLAYQPVVVGKKVEMGVGIKKFFSTISDALQSSDERVMIKVNPGVYNQKLEIKKKNVKIQAIEISQNCIIINSECPTIFVDMPNKDDKIYMQSLKLVNTCDSNIRHENLNGNYESIKKQNYMGIVTNEQMNSCIYIKKGIVQLDECKISMATSNSKQVSFACIVVEKQGCLIMNRTQIRGGDGTIGVLSKGGTVIMKQSIIKDHGVAGLIYTSKEKCCTISIKNCSFSKCNQGIVLNGPFVAAFENNVVSQAREVGVVVKNGGQSKIFNNEIKYCKVGVQIQNSFPMVLKNYILNSSEWGVKIKSSNGIMCKPTFKFNSVNQNSEGGFFIEGSLNFSNIFSNQLNFNNKYGIKIANRACPHIFANKVNKTLGNGVHAQPNCSIFLQKNQIMGSLKCNLVVLGPNNIDTFIYRNVISGARGQGIFCMFGQRYRIKDNEISQNYNGIVSLSGVMNIQENSIKGNNRNGILLIRDNDVMIVENEIEGNKKCGIFIRDSSIGRIQGNYFGGNNIQVVIENDDCVFDGIQQENVFEDGCDLRVPKNYRCEIM